MILQLWTNGVYVSYLSLVCSWRAKWKEAVGAIFGRHTRLPSCDHIQQMRLDGSEGEGGTRYSNNRSCDGGRGGGEY